MWRRRVQLGSDMWWRETSGQTDERVYKVLNNSEFILHLVSFELATSNAREGRDHIWEKEKTKSMLHRCYKIQARMEPTTYKLCLLVELSIIHNVFHVSMSRKYIPDLSHILQERPLKVKENLAYEKGPVPYV